MTYTLPAILPAAADRQTWEQALRPALLARWRELLGQPSFDPDSFEATPQFVTRLTGDTAEAQWWQIPTGPSQSMRVILLVPNDLRPGQTRPAAVIPYYHPEDPAGLVIDHASHSLAWDQEPTDRKHVRQFALHLARQGFIVVACEAFPFNTVPAPEGADKTPFRWWQAAADKLLHDHPHWTGLGKLVHDTRLATDFLLQQAAVDRSRVAMMGHSLGGKMTFYSAALDQRIAAAIASDFGLPWDTTNWHDAWYLGDRAPKNHDDLAHHQLLALLAPRAFYLIAGQNDSQASWEFLDAARPVHDLYDAPADALTGFNHATGHSPTIESLDKAYTWLSTRFNIPRHDWQ